MLKIVYALFLIFPLSTFAADCSAPDPEVALDSVKRYWVDVNQISVESFEKYAAQDLCFLSYWVDRYEARIDFILDSKLGWNEEVFNIDRLKIVLKRRNRKFDECVTGSITLLDLGGVIGPDSTFAMSELFRRNPPCRDAAGNTVAPPAVVMNSRGGLLADGYALGKELRRLNALVRVPDRSECASSCADAFLGGARRIVDREATVMFHAPYFIGKNELGVRDVDCDVGEEALAELRAYYQEMTGAETGDRLFERTMWYCSADDGWVVKGASAAELYGIATEK